MMAPAYMLRPCLPSLASWHRVHGQGGAAEKLFSVRSGAKQPGCWEFCAQGCRACSDCTKACGCLEFKRSSSQEAVPSNSV